MSATKDFCIAKAISMAEAADRAGLSRQTLWRWHAGRATPRIAQARQFAKVVRLPGQQLGDIIAALLKDAQRSAAATAELGRPTAAGSVSSRRPRAARRRRARAR